MTFVIHSEELIFLSVNNFYFYVYARMKPRLLAWNPLPAFQEVSESDTMRLTVIMDLRLSASQNENSSAAVISVVNQIISASCRLR